MTKGAQKRDVIPSILLILWTCLILFVTVSSSVAQSEAVAWLSSLSESWGLPRYTPAKLFHLVAYAVWAWLYADVLVARWLEFTLGQRIVLVLLILVAFASVQELLQLNNVNRNASVFDILLNITGGGVGLALHLLVDQRSGPSRRAMSDEIQQTAHRQE